MTDDEKLQLDTEGYLVLEGLMDSGLLDSLRRRVEELFQRLQGVSDTQSTNTHYSLSRLRLVEAAVRAVVNDDFALGPAVRRWLDDDEYVVRRRIHRDVRAAVGGA